MRWLIATHNRDKVLEIKAIFADMSVELLDLEDFPEIGPIAETGTTLQENALQKARYVHRVTGMPAIADDTGLEVAALDGGPGVYSARFAGEQVTYSQNYEKLLKEMEQVPDNQRGAHFRTCAAYVDDERELTAEGMVEGMITREPLGTNGFGYDPVFLVDGSGQTFGQMTAAQKQSISHRARAFEALHQLLARSLPRNENKETLAQTH